ncbi:MAG TPA: hypothetical protein VJT73_19195 [Polyangiaceae bacterium]|nr:hypothetical protein [Polyangiaceae bacterium]
MSIDRIGKGNGPAGIGGAGAPSAREVTSQPVSEFKVASAEAPGAAPLDRLRAGEISVSQYLDLKVSEATAHLDQRLTAEQLSFIRNSLRQQLASDPMLAQLVKSTTGALPPPTE